MSVIIQLNSEDNVIKAYNYLDLLEKINYVIDTRCPCFRAYIESKYVNCDKKCQDDIKIVLDRIRQIENGTDGVYTAPTDDATSDMYKQIKMLQPYPELHMYLEDIEDIEGINDRTIFDYYIGLLNFHRLGYVFMPLKKDNLAMIKTDLRSVTLGQYHFKQCQYMGVLNVTPDVFKSTSKALQSANFNELCSLIPQLNKYNSDNILEYFELYSYL